MKTISDGLRRRRADAVLEREYERVRDTVARSVRAKLTNKNIAWDDQIVGGAYNAAWHAVHEKLIRGEEVTNLPGLLAEVTYNRFLDQYRTLHVDRFVEDPRPDAGVEDDFDSQLDAKMALDYIVNAFKGHLTTRECQAVVMCLLHGMRRKEAAAVLGIDPNRMEKVMDGSSKKVGAILKSIEDGTWCENQKSLMLAYAHGILAEDGPKWRLAREHLNSCPSCRADVRRTRGYAAVIPPIGLPGFLAGTGTAGGLLDNLNELLLGARETVFNLVEHVPEVVATAGVGSTAAAVTGSGAGTGGGSAAVGTATTATAAGSSGSAAGATFAGVSAGTASTGAAGGAVAAKVAAVAVTAALAGGGGVAVGAIDLPAPKRNAPRQQARAAVPAALPGVTVRMPPSGSATSDTAGQARRADERAKRRRAQRRAARRRARLAQQPTANATPVPESTPAPTPEPTVVATPAPTVAATPTPQATTTPTPTPDGGGEFDFEG